jgi:23S rRNA (uridine2552-2'-O)-methyltransferase
VTRSENPYARQDALTRSAKAQGYPARSVFKLSEIDQRLGVFRPGQHVLDLGASPGSWTLFASERIGARGRVLAVDVEPLAQPLPENVTALQADVLSVEPSRLSALAPYDVVLSDMAPSTSGNKVRDQSRSVELFLRALDLARELGRPGCTFVGKVFMSQELPSLKRRAGEHFDAVKIIRPAATRKPSSEVFVCGLRLKTRRAGC